MRNVTRIRPPKGTTPPQKVMIAVDAAIAENFCSRLCSPEATVTCIKLAIEMDPGDSVMHAEALHGVAAEITRIANDLDVCSWTPEDPPEESAEA